MDMEKNVSESVYQIKEGNVSVVGTVKKIEQTKAATNYMLQGCKLYVSKKLIKEGIEDIQQGQNTISSDDANLQTIVYDLKEVLISYSKESNAGNMEAYNKNFEAERNSLQSVKIGNKILADGKFIKFSEARNEGNFNQKEYYKSLGIYAHIKLSSSPESIKILDATPNHFKEYTYELRIKAKSAIEQICHENKQKTSFFNEENAGAICAITLGDKEQLDENTKEKYQINGISHVLAISGLHISLIGIAVYTLLRSRFKITVSGCVAMVVTVGFAVMSGLGISAVRAVVMYALHLFAKICGRTYDTLSALALSAFLLMIDNPFVILNSGFQMSFGAIVGIVFVYPALKEFVQVSKLSSVKKKIVDSICLSLSVNWILIPIIACNYYEIPSYSILLNLIIIPLMSIVFVSAISSVIAYGIIKVIGATVLLPGCAIIQLYDFLCTLIMKMPLFNIVIGKPEIWQILCYYGLVIVIVIIIKKVNKQRIADKEYRESHIAKEGRTISKDSIKLRSISCLTIIGMTILMVFVICIKWQSGLNVYFMDVGQGDGIVMQCNGKVIMIDGGSSDIKAVGKYRLISALKAKAIQVIDYAIITHTDIDHISGISEIIEKGNVTGIKVKNLVLPIIEIEDENYNELLNTAVSKGINILYIKRGDKLKFNELEIECLHPFKGFITSEKNNYSTVLSVTYGTFNMLLTGDISQREEQYLFPVLKNKYTILKVAHHGSKNSTTQEFVNTIKPRYSIISCGVRNSYGHPHMETLERLKNVSSTILRTDELGQVTIKTNGRNMTIEPFLK